MMIDMKLWSINKLIKWTGFRLIIEGDFIEKPKNPIKLYFRRWKDLYEIKDVERYKV